MIKLPDDFVEQLLNIMGDWSGNIFYRHSPPSADSRSAGVSYKQKYAWYVHEVLVNLLYYNKSKLAQEKECG